MKRLSYIACSAPRSEPAGQPGPAADGVSQGSSVGQTHSHRNVLVLGHVGSKEVGRQKIN